MEQITPMAIVMFKYLLIVLAAGFGAGVLLNSIISGAIIWRKRIAGKKDRLLLVLAGALTAFFSMLGLLLFFVVSYFSRLEFRPTVLAVFFLAIFLAEARLAGRLSKAGGDRFMLAALFNIPYFALVAAPFFIRK